MGECEGRARAKVFEGSNLSSGIVRAWGAGCYSMKFLTCVRIGLRAAETLSLDLEIDPQASSTYWYCMRRSREEA